MVGGGQIPRENRSMSPISRGRQTTRIEAEVWVILAGRGAASAAVALVLPPRLLALSGWMFASLAVIMPTMARRWRALIKRAENADRSTAT